jgi:hypothetical protein
VRASTWFEADLYDQLQIIQIFACLADLAVPAERVTLSGHVGSHLRPIAAT